MYKGEGQSIAGTEDGQSLCQLMKAGSVAGEGHVAVSHSCTQVLQDNLMLTYLLCNLHKGGIMVNAYILPPNKYI